MRVGAALLLLVSLLLPGALSAENPLLERAVDAYASAQEIRDRDERVAAFRSVERIFSKLAAEGYQSADLYVNTGNAALQAERLGAAVLAYRRALLLDPDHPRALRNLEYARGLLPKWLPRPEPAGLLDSFFSWHASWTRSERAVAAALGFFLACVFVATGIFFRMTPVRNMACLPGLAWLGLLLSLFFGSGLGASREGVVSVEEVVLRVSDSHLAAPALPRPLPAGAEIRVLERRPSWLRVRLASGRVAWLPVEAVTTLLLDPWTSG